MKKYIPILKNTQLFQGVSEEEILSMLLCLQAKIQFYKKGEYVVRQGDDIQNIMILVSGKLHIQYDDYWGNRSILNMISEGEMFGEAYSTPESGAVMNDVLAIEDSAVIFFDVNRIITVCSSACRFHSMVIQNLFFATLDKNRKLMTKLSFMSKRTTREKLIAYLSEEAKRNNSNIFSIPFNRQQLADYLSVDRSAMSNELCKMRDDKLITFEKNRFTLL